MDIFTLEIVLHCENHIQEKLLQKRMSQEIKHSFLFCKQCFEDIYKYKKRHLRVFSINEHMDMYSHLNLIS